MRENQREDQIVSAIDAEIDATFQQRREALNRWMLRLPLRERRRRWGEYAARMCQLEEDVVRQIALKRKPAASQRTATAITAYPPQVEANACVSRPPGHAIK